MGLAACDTSALPFGASEPPPPPAEAPTAPPEPTPVVLDGTIQVEEAGVSLRYPQGWETRQTSEHLMLAPSAAAIESPTLGEDMVLLVDWTSLNTVTDYYTSEASIDIHALFETSSQGPQQAGYTIGQTTPITVDGRTGLYADLSMEGGAGQLVILLAPPQLIRVLGQVASSAWEEQRPVFEAIVQSMTFSAPPPTPTSPPPSTPTPANQAIQPTVITEGPPGFLLRLGSHEGPRNGRFVSARGVATAPDGTVYLAESGRGVWVFASDGTLQTTFGEDEVLLDAHDVDRGPDGDIFVADYGRNAIVRFAPDGTVVRQWGEGGDGEGQFGLQSPQHLAVGNDGSVYALDSHTDPTTQSTVNSIIRFHGDDGSFLERIDLPGMVPEDLALDTTGMIYLADSTAGAIVKLDPTGTVLAQFGADVLPGGITPGALDVDRVGNIYVATWDNGILKLAPDGALVASGGTMAEPGTLPAPGQFSNPNGIAVAPGGVVWVSDNAGEYSALTAMRLESEDQAPPGEGSVVSTDGVTSTTATTGTGRGTIRPSGALSHQWASEATASSHYGEDYGPENVVGPPDVEGCQDSPNAWAPATPDTLETLEVTFETPVFASQINIHQNHQPGFVTEVELLDERGSYTTVYTGTARLQSVCPQVMKVSFEPLIFRVVGARLTIDQRGDANWSEIDAVELIGIP